MVIFDKKDLKYFDLNILKKMLEIQIKKDKFEGAILIRDVIDQRVRDIRFNDEQDIEEELL